MQERYWILNDDREVVKVADVLTWGRFYENGAMCNVGDEYIAGARISTKFIGIDHQFGDGPPLLFETMIFGGAEDQWQERCSTWEQAEAMHAQAVKLAGLEPSEPQLGQ